MNENDIRLLRRYADGETTPDESAAAERILASEAEAGRLVESERRLRDRIRVCMGARPAVPDGLADRVRGALEAASEAPVRPSAAVAAGPARDRTPLPAPGSARVAAPRRANVFAIAASLALAAGAVLYGIFGPRIDDQGRLATNLVVDDAIFASGEHAACATSVPKRNRKLRLRDAEASRADLLDWLGVSALVIFDLTRLGYDFVGSGHCMVPGPEPSGHLMYARTTPGSAPAMVSVFVVPDRGQFSLGAPIRPAIGNWIEIDARGKCRSRVLETADRGVVYFMVCCDEADLDAMAVLAEEQLLNAP